jgi:zinc transporter, ZIP family
MSWGTTVLLGAFSGLTIFLGLPTARFRGISRPVQGFLNALALGILIFLLWDVLSKADDPVSAALSAGNKANPASLILLIGLFIGGIAAGLLSLIYLNHHLTRRFQEGPGAALTLPMQSAQPGRLLAMMIAAGLGLHNFSEGLAIGQSAVSGAISLAAVLIIGFALHNITEGFGIAAPMAGEMERPSWSFLILAGLVGGGPTFLGTVIGYSFTSPYLFVVFLTLAAGALIYVIGEMFSVAKKMNTSTMLGWGVLLGFIAGYGTDLILTYAGA